MSNRKWRPPPGSTPIDWEAITSTPIADYESGRRNIKELESMIDIATRFNMDAREPQWKQPDATLALGRLLRVLLAKCDEDANRTYTEKEQLGEKLSSLQVEMKSKDAELSRAKDARDEAMRNLSAAQSINDKVKADANRHRDDVRRKEDEISRLGKDIEGLNKTIDRMNRDAGRARAEMDELRRDAEVKESTFGRTEKSNTQMLAEHSHLLKKYRTVSDENAKLKDELEHAQQSLQSSRASYEAQVEQLTQHVQSLRQECEEVRMSRDRAEIALEERERQALSDLQEMQGLHQLELTELETQNNVLRDQYVQMKTEMEILKRTEARVPEHEIRAKDDIIDRLRRENEELRSGAYEANSSAASEAGLGLASSTRFGPGSPTTVMEANVLNKLLADKSRLEQEVDALQHEVRSLEMRMETQDADNIQLHKALKEYESGDEGLRRLRAEAADANRTISSMAEENQQLRERLSNVEDTVTLCEALKELCLRVGVTQDELDKLYNKDTTRFNEMETLRQEVRSLKEEVEWVEKERKHWMRKVRLQPLLDTKLRFELGLTQDQLTQLDYIVDQMKSGGVVVDDGDYREKYYEEVKAHQRQVQVFNEQMRVRIESVLASFMAGGQAAPEELEAIRQRMAQAAVTAESNLNVSLAAKEASAQAGSLQRRIHQQEMSYQELLDQMAELRTENAKLSTERDVMRREMELYRGLVLEGAFGATSDDQIAALEASIIPPASMQQTPTRVGPSGDGTPAAAAANDVSNANVDVSAVTNTSSAHGYSEANARIREALLALRRRTAHGQPATSAEQQRFINVLQQQVRTKEMLLTEMERNYLREEDRANTLAKELEGAAKRNEELTARVRLQQEDVEGANQAADAADAKIQELERVKVDLTDACRRTLPAAHNELLQKIVLLRQREGRLAQRLREVMQERDRLTVRDAEHERYVKEHLEVIRSFLAKGEDAIPNPIMSGRNTLLSTVLPNRTGQVQLEDEVLQELQRQMAQLSRGELLEEDRRFILDTRRLYVDLRQQARVMDLMAEANQFKRQLDKANEELEALRQTNGGCGHAPVTASSTTTTSTAASDLYARRLEAKALEVQHLEDALRDANGQVDAMRAQLAAVGSAGGGVVSGGDAGGVEGGGADTAVTPPTAPDQQQHQPSVLGRQTFQTAETIRRLEKELARYKSMNLGLVQSAIDEQSNRKALQIQLQARDREIFLLKENGHTQTVSDFIAAALKDSVVLMQQNEMAQHMSKKMKLQLVVSEANFRVAANEAAGYKLSAYRLYKNYVDHVTKIIEVVRRLQRTCEGAMTAREVVLHHKRVADAGARVGEVEEELTRVKANAAMAEETAKLLEDQLALLRAKSPSDAAQLLAKLSTDTRARLKTTERTNVTLQDDIEHLKKKLSRTDEYIKAVEEEVGRLEVSAAGLDFGDEFANKLQSLHETVFAKTEAPPVALTVLPDASAQYLNGNSADDKVIKSYRDALDQQANLSRQCASLTTELKESQKQLIISEGKVNALREELTHAENRVSTAGANVEHERAKARQREERLVAAHMAQSEVMQRAVDHNTACLKDMIASKDRAVAKLQEQLAAEREKFLEHQLLDTTRMERLHEQMFKENNAMVERFKAALNQQGSAVVSENGGRMPPAGGAGQHGGLHSALETSLQSQVAALTREVVELRATTQELRSQNATLECTLSEQMLQHQRSLREAMLQRQKEQHDTMYAAGANHEAAVNDAAHQQAAAAAAANGGGGVNTLLPVESSLYALTHEQSIALDMLRKRETELKETVAKQAGEIVRLEALLREAPPATSAGMGNLECSIAVRPNAALPAHESLAELHTYISTLEAQLQQTQKVALDAQLQEHQSTIKWREQLANMKAEVAAQSACLENAKEAARQNGNLRTDMAQLQAQHDKMVAATAVLTQRLQQKEVEREGRERQLEGDAALAQKMSSLQQEASERIANLQKRMTSVQQELQTRIGREEELLKKAKDAQKMALDQHEQLLTKDIAIRQLTLQVTRLKEQAERRREPHLRCAEKTTQTSEPLRSAVATEISTAFGGNSHIIPTVETIMELPPGFELSAAVPTPPAETKTLPASCNQFVQTDPIPRPSPKRVVSPSGNSRKPSPTGPPRPISDQPFDTSPSTGNGGSSRTPPSGTRRAVSSVAALRRTTASASPKGATTQQQQQQQPPSAPPLDPQEINRIVAKLQKEHGHELIKYRELSRRMERDLEDSEAARRREQQAAEGTAKQLTAQLNDLRAKLAAAETAHREEMLRFLQERNRQQLHDAGRQPRGGRSVKAHADPTATAGGGGQGPSTTTTVTETTTRVTTHTAGAASSPEGAEANVMVSPLAPLGVAPIEAFHRGAVSKQQAEVAAAAEELKAHQALRRTREEVEEKGRLVTTLQKERDKARGELQEATRRITQLSQQQQLLQSALAAAEAAVTRQQQGSGRLVTSAPSICTNCHGVPLAKLMATMDATSGADHTTLVAEGAHPLAPIDPNAPIPKDAVASPRDIRHHKREVMRLESIIDALRREVSVTMEVELRSHVMEKDRLVIKLRELEAAAATGPTTSTSVADGAADTRRSVAVGPGSQLQAQQDARDILRDKLGVISTLESRVLQLEGQLLDVRFERETLAMKCSRLEKHLEDVLQVDNASGGGNGGAVSMRGKGYGGQSPLRGQASHSKEVGALEAVIESLRAIVERVQSENAMLKGNAVNNSKYLDAVREVKALKQRERELLEHLAVLSSKLQEQQASSLPGGKSAEQNASLQRKLKLAQATADQYAAELRDLKARLGMPPSPAPAPRPTNNSPTNSSPSPTATTTAGNSNAATAPVVTSWHQQQMDFLAAQEAHLAALRRGQSGMASTYYPQTQGGSTDVARVLNLSPYAAENHHLDMHHRVAQ